MMNVKNKRCVSEWCDSLINGDKYNNYCCHCFVNKFPDHKLSRNHNTKEKIVYQFMKSKLINLDIVRDKTIKDGCSKRRPDIYMDMGSHVIIEVDEYQHSSYDNICENKRVMELSMDINHRPIVFIIFNPDNYIKPGGEKISSCWKLTKSEKMTIRDTQEWEMRLETLFKKVSYWIKKCS